jgi:hypothetical protein
MTRTELNSRFTPRSILRLVADRLDLAGVC